jgi:hypothetical protein
MTAAMAHARGQTGRHEISEADKEARDEAWVRWKTLLKQLP